MKQKLSFALTVLLILIFSGSAFTQENIYAKSSGFFFDTQNLSSVTEVELSCKEIKTLPKEIFEMNNLQMLDVSNNELTELPDGIRNLKNLRVLMLNGNNIYELPEELSRLKFLKEIYLDYNIWCYRLSEIRKITSAKIFLID